MGLGSSINFLSSAGTSLHPPLAGISIVHDIKNHFGCRCSYLVRNYSYMQKLNPKGAQESCRARQAKTLPLSVVAWHLNVTLKRQKGITCTLATA